jgi:hypothetical protein
MARVLPDYVHYQMIIHVYTNDDLLWQIVGLRLVLLD